MLTWHVVHHSGKVLAVYGAALKDMAEQKAKDMEGEVGLVVPVATIQHPTRLHIGDAFPPGKQ